MELIIMFDLNYIKKHFGSWNKKTTIAIGNSRNYKIIGCGKSAFKVLKFEPQAELGGIGGWSQVFWNFKNIPKNSDAEKVIEKLEKEMRALG